MRVRVSTSYWAGDRCQNERRFRGTRAAARPELTASANHLSRPQVHARANDVLSNGSGRVARPADSLALAFTIPDTAHDAISSENKTPFCTLTTLQNSIVGPEHRRGAQNAKRIPSINSTFSAVDTMPRCPPIFSPHNNPTAVGVASSSTSDPESPRTQKMPPGFELAPATSSCCHRNAFAGPAVHCTVVKTPTMKPLVTRV